MFAVLDGVRLAARMKRLIFPLKNVESTGNDDHVHFTC